MTYIIAWKTKKSVFIAGDTAIKTTYLDLSTPKLRSERSSFDEPHILDENIKIEESRLKIFTIKEKLAIGIAGNVDNATRVIEQFQIRLSKEKDIKLEVITNCIKEALFVCAADQLRGNRDFQLIIEFTDNNVPYLFSYNYDCDKQIKEHEEIIDIGTGKNSYAAEITKKIIEQFLKYNDVDRHILILVNALMQGFILHDESMRKCVGGLFIGLQIDKNGVQWQRDTSYILYEDIFDKPTLINVLVRENVVGISSPHKPRTFYTTSTNHSQESLKKWWSNNKKEINNYFISCESKYFVFISKKYRLIILVFDYINTEKKLFSINTTQPNKLDVQVNKELMESLLLEPKDFPSNGIPMLIKWF